MMNRLKKVRKRTTVISKKRNPHFVAGKHDQSITFMQTNDRQGYAKWYPYRTTFTGNRIYVRTLGPK